MRDRAGRARSAFSGQLWCTLRHQTGRFRCWNSRLPAKACMLIGEKCGLVVYDSKDERVGSWKGLVVIGILDLVPLDLSPLVVVRNSFQEVFLAKRQSIFPEQPVQVGIVTER